MTNIDLKQLLTVTGGAQLNVNVDDLLRALQGGAKTKQATRVVHALGKLGVR